MTTSLKRKIMPMFDNQIVYKVLTSHVGLLAQAIIAAVFFHLEMPVVNIAFSLVVMMIAIWFSRDMMPCFAPLMFCSMAMLEMYGHFISDYIFLWPIAMFVVVGLIVRPFIFREKYRKGKMLPAIIMVAVAITLGGIGSLLPQQYFTGLNMYYVILLGVGMAVAYLYMTHYVNVNSKNNAMQALSRSMLYIGLLGVLMVLPVQLQALSDKGVLIYVQWKNNVSTFLLLSMPFAFYYGSKVDNYGILFSGFGALQYVALMLVRSRGGMIFGTVIFVACGISTILFNSRLNRRIAIIATAITAVAVIVVLIVYNEEISKYLGIIDVDPNESRAHMYKLAISNFFKFPIFGSGLGFFGDYYHPAPGAMYWYHSTPFQVIGSLGMVGVVAYLYQLWIRLRVCSGKKTIFNLYAFLSFAAFELMALVNPGDFCPMPYVVSLTLILTVIEKGNSSKLNNIGLRRELSPPLYKG